MAIVAINDKQLTFSMTRLNNSGNETIIASHIRYDNTDNRVLAFAVYDENGVVMFHLADKQRELNLVQRALDAIGLLDSVMDGMETGAKFARELLDKYAKAKTVKRWKMAVSVVGGMGGVATNIAVDQLANKVPDDLTDWITRKTPMCYRTQSGEDVFDGPTFLK